MWQLECRSMRNTFTSLWTSSPVWKTIQWLRHTSVFTNKVVKFWGITLCPWKTAQMELSQLTNSMLVSSMMFQSHIRGVFVYLWVPFQWGSQRSSWSRPAGLPQSLRSGCLQCSGRPGIEWTSASHISETAQETGSDTDQDRRAQVQTFVWARARIEKHTRPQRHH